MDKIEASDLLLPVLIRNFLCTSISSLELFKNFLITLAEAKTAIRTKFLNLEQEQVLAEAYIPSNVRYCPLIWMFCGKMSDNLIVKTHYRTLRAIYDT